MKKFSKIIIYFFITTFLFASCKDLLDVDSKRLTTDSEYGLKNPADSVYSMFGVFSQLQKLSDSYVLLGELRGDLLDITPSSDMYLREINNFDISKDNIYVNIKNYYAVINNCNYIIHNLDTTVVDKGQKFKLREYAAVKAIRAWTFMQIALNFKTVKYYENPILTVSDAEKTYPEFTLTELADKLIPDLEPLKDVPTPDLKDIDGYNTSFSYFPIRFILGDLYLWKGAFNNNPSDYENAATNYRDLMYQDRVIINKLFTTYWMPVNNTISNSFYMNWNAAFTYNSGEVMTAIMSPTEYGQKYYLDSLNNQSKFIPSDISIRNWDNQTYYLNEASNSQGDLRKYGSIWYKEITTPPAAGSTYTNISGSKPYVYKYKIYKQNVIVYRSSLLYLRYAEAVNRLNKPRLAFAVLKYGLNSTNMFNTKIIPASERDASNPTYMNFSDSRFNNNAGIRMRGLGNMDKDTTFYTFRKQNAMKDSVLYVEDLIQQELALETAYEGNRFQDLMRIAIRRIQTGEGDASFLADKVAAKHAVDGPATKTKLMTIDNWYIKK
ncbi:MAG: RagB/SusD family nutrient uptake outer membrane protein [Paludibacter sp.]|nr:RagB/SusD family nutrient uptake outer membrane protein [Paludibacter sp.]